MISKSHHNDIHIIRETLTLLHALIENKEHHYSTDELRDVEYYMTMASTSLNNLDS